MFRRIFGLVIGVVSLACFAVTYIQNEKTNPTVPANKTITTVSGCTVDMKLVKKEDGFGLIYVTCRDGKQLPVTFTGEEVSKLDNISVGGQVKCNFTHGKYGLLDSACS